MNDADPKRMHEIREVIAMNRVPTVKTLSRIHDADPKRMRQILQMTRAQLLKIECVSQLDRASYHPPRTYTIRLEALNQAARTHGVESITLGDEVAEYLNTGDIYSDTLIYWRGNYRVQAVDEFIGTMGRRGLRAY